MRVLLLCVVSLCLTAQATSAQVASSYFSAYRQVTVSRPDRQNYLVADGELWMQARPDLADIRLYDAHGKEIPYKMLVERDDSRPEPGSPKPVTRARVLDLGRVGDTTRFILELEPNAEYNRVNLELSAHDKDFLTRATVEGADDIHSQTWTVLGTYPVFDFSREKLGGNSALYLPVSRFTFLRVTLPSIDPQQIQGATVALVAARQERWSELPIDNFQVLQQSGKTIITWHQQTAAPVERFHFVVDPDQTNFRRHTVIEGIEENGHSLILGEVSIGRIDKIADGKTVHTEGLDVDATAHFPQFRVTIDNGDDPPLRIRTVQPLLHERRIYFDPQGSSVLRLYYGDPKANMPEYDYAKVFAEQDSAVPADMGPSESNPLYQPRQDDRPWSERQRWIVWAALILSVFGLGVIAFRSLKQQMQ